jgi:hypothetical protein
MAKTWKTSSSWHRARKATSLLPTRSRSREELILQTYGGGNDPLEAGDDGTARPVFTDGGGGDLASRVIPMAAVEVGLLPPSDGLAQEGPVRQRDGGGLLGNVGLV